MGVLLIKQEYNVACFVSVTSTDDPALAVYHNIREKDLVGREGLFVAEGKVVLSVLLRSDAFRAQSLLVVNNRLPGLLPLLHENVPDCPVYIVPQAVMDGIAGFHVHRGILGIGRKVVLPALSTFLERMGEDALVVVLCGIANHDNMGALFRNAAAFAAHGIVMDSSCCDPLYRKAIRVSVGAALKVPYVQGGAIMDLLKALDSYGFTTLAFSASAPLALEKVARPRKLALLFGSEGKGLPQTVLEQLQTVRIPIAADFDSLNVATASGIALARFANPERLTHFVEQPEN